jgi:hypothetical protein
MRLKTDRILGDTKMSQQYEIVIHGHLASLWLINFEGMQVTCLPDGNTCIAYSLPDQSALYGLLMRPRDLGIKLVCVNAVEPKEEK